jgi:hypothetical protein
LSSIHAIYQGSNCATILGRFGLKPAICGLLSQLDWDYCGQLDGLDIGDPELFYKASR